MSSIENAIAEKLRHAGHAVNAERRAVLRALAAAPGPISIEDIWRNVRVELARIALSTVHRTVRILINLGVVEVAARNGAHRLVQLTPPQRILTLVLPATGEVRQIEAPSAIDALETVLEAAGYSLIEGVSLRVRLQQGAGT